MCLIPRLILNVKIQIDYGYVDVGRGWIETRMTFPSLQHQCHDPLVTQRRIFLGQSQIDSFKITSSCLKSCHIIFLFISASYQISMLSFTAFALSSVSLLTVECMVVTVWRFLSNQFENQLHIITLFPVDLPLGFTLESNYLITNMMSSLTNQRRGHIHTTGWVIQCVQSEYNLLTNLNVSNWSLRQQHRCHARVLSFGSPGLTIISWLSWLLLFLFHFLEYIFSFFRRLILKINFTWMKSLYFTLFWTDNLAGNGILGWKYYCSRILRALLYSLLASPVVHERRLVLSEFLFLCRWVCIFLF